MKKLVTLIVILILLMAIAGVTVLAVMSYMEIPITTVIKEYIKGFDDDAPTEEEIDEIDYEKAHKYHDIIYKYATEYDVPIALVYAVIECESSFREDAKSSVGACGLMQLMPETFKDICKLKDFEYTAEHIMDPDANIRCGTYYLSSMYRMFDDWELAVAAYNAGPGNVQKWLKNDDYTDDGKLVYIPFKETSNHVQKVSKAWEKYEKQLKG